MKAVFVWAIFLKVSSLSVLACSIGDGYLPLTEYELIKATEAIVLARPVIKTGDTVDFNILEVLKGDFHDKEFRGNERHTSCDDYSYFVEYDEYERFPGLLLRDRPMIKPKYLLFLFKTRNGWEIENDAADRMNDRIFDPNSSTFLTRVRHFIRISSLNDYEIEKRELKALRKLARSGRDPKAYPKELVELIDDHLARPTSMKSYKDLVGFYSRLSKEKRRNVLWAFAWGKHPEAANFITNILRSPIPMNYLGPISKYIERTKNESLLVRLARNYPKIDKDSRWSLMWAMINTADERHTDLMLAAMRSADTDEAGRLSEWFVRHPVSEATEIVQRLVGKDYPEYSDLTFNLAGMGDIGTIEWAKAFMNSPNEERWRAYYAIAHSPLDEADRLAKGVIKGVDPDGLAWLLQGYEESHNPNKWDRLRDVINLKNRSAKVEHWLRQTLERMADNGDDKAVELLRVMSEPA